MEAPQRSRFTISIPVRWGDMDANGHVNNAVYSTYFEQARIAWFDSVFARHGGHAHGYVVARIVCNFIKPVVYPATLSVSVASGRPGRSSFALIQEIRAETSQEKLADAEVTMVRINRETGKSQPLPDWLRNLLPLEGGK
jgi:acyl-CoA thioester hydrolase